MSPTAPFVFRSVTVSNPYSYDSGVIGSSSSIFFLRMATRRSSHLPGFYRSLHECSAADSEVLRFAQNRCRLQVRVPGRCLQGGQGCRSSFFSGRGENLVPFALCFESLFFMCRMSVCCRRSTLSCGRDIPRLRPRGCSRTISPRTS